MGLPLGTLQYKIISLLFVWPFPAVHYMEVLLQLSDDQEDGMGNLVFVIETNTTVSERLPSWR